MKHGFFLPFSVPGTSFFEAVEGDLKHVCLHLEFRDGDLLLLFELLADEYPVHQVGNHEPVDKIIEALYPGRGKEQLIPFDGCLCEQNGKFGIVGLHGVPLVVTNGCLVGENRI